MRAQMPVQVPELVPENGKVYDLELVKDGEGGLALRPVETVR